MAEQMPMRPSEPVDRRGHIAKLRFAPNAVLLNKLKPFYLHPEQITRMGRQGLFLYSAAALPVARRYSRTGYELPSESIAIDEVDRIDRDIRHLSDNEKHLAMGETLIFTRLKMGGLAIRMNVQIQGRLIKYLESTPFLSDDKRSVDVMTALAPGQHAPGTVMQQAATELQQALYDKRSGAGTDSVDLMVIHQR